MTATLKDFDLTVKGVQTEPTITAKATGTMNFVDSLSKITYDFTVKNVQGYVDTTNLKVFNVLPDGSESELNFEAIDSDYKIDYSIDKKPPYGGRNEDGLSWRIKEIDVQA